MSNQLNCQEAYDMSHLKVTATSSCALVIAVLALSACSQSTPTTSTSGVDTYKEQTTTTVTVDKETGKESRTTTTEVITPGRPPVKVHRVDVDAEPSEKAIININSDGASIRAETDDIDVDVPEHQTTRVRAPFFKLDKNAGTGSVHIKMPFVHIDKDAGGTARVDIGRH